MNKLPGLVYSKLCLTTALTTYFHDGATVEKTCLPLPFSRPTTAAAAAAHGGSEQHLPAFPHDLTFQAAAPFVIRINSKFYTSY